MVTDVASRLSVRTMTERDIPGAAELSQEQGWPHREEDWALFLQLGEGLVAESDGKIAGTIMGWRYGRDMAAIGMVIVTNAAQGQGLGRRLMEDMLQRLDGRTIVLNATEQGLPLYRKLGFVETGRILQHQGPAPAVPLVKLRRGERVRPMGAVDQVLAALYSRASGMDRTRLLETLALEGSAIVFARDHDPVGFALLRRFGRGWSIAPVVAPDLEAAKALVSHFLGIKQGAFCRIDVTEDSGLSPWLEDLGLPQVGSVVTMALGPRPAADPSIKVFGLAAQALG